MIYHLLNHWFGDANYAYQSVLFRSTCAILIAFGLVVWQGPRLIRLLTRLKIGDQPEFDHQSYNELTRNKANTPTMGGALIVAAIIVCILLLADLTNYYIRMGIFCVIWLSVLGGVDDWLKLTAKRRGGTRDGLKMYEKLLFQIGLGVLLGYFVYRHGSVQFDERETYKILTVPFYKQGITLSLATFMVITILVTAFTSNAVNLTDGMDGLAAGCTALCGFAFMLLTTIVGDMRWSDALLVPHVPRSGELAIVCGAIVGACLGFLWYNCHPARVFMGDTGSLPLGGIIGYVAIVTRQELMLFLVGGVFVIEAVSVMLQVGYFKATGGKRMFRMAPIHHAFHLGGWTETQTVTRFWLMAAIFAAFALATVKLR